MKALFPALLLVASAIAQALPSVHAIAEKIDQHYNSLQTLKCDFTETYSGMGVQRTESGALELKKPGKMRWDYREPREKIFVSDGKTAWFYVAGQQQARKSQAKELEDLRSPLRYLLGKTKLEKEIEALALAPDVKPAEAGDVVLRGRPKGMPSVEDIVIEANSAGQLRRLVIHESDGATTEFRFSNIAENIAIADAAFHFTPPPGVEIINSKDITGPQ